MSRTNRLRIWTMVAVLLVLLAQSAFAGDGPPPIGKAAPAPPAQTFVTPYFFPSLGGFGGFGGYGFFGYYSPFIDPVPHASTNPYLPKYWWSERYPTLDPRQAGYNPNAGYAKEEVTTLLLETSPKKARVVLDGLYIGTSDSLGPFQLPAGEHTLRVEAAGFEPSETVLKIEQPVLQQLEVRLKPTAATTTHQ
ncbi:MAG: PEGA domain-containing protein [Terriglobia bacterium]